MQHMKWYIFFTNYAYYLTIYVYVHAFIFKLAAQKHTIVIVDHMNQEHHTITEILNQTTASVGRRLVD